MDGEQVSLKELIENTPEGETLYLNEDYSIDEYNLDWNGLTLEKSITLDFKNHTINLNKPSYLFQIKGNDITIQNLVLVNAGTSTVYNYDGTSNFKMINITFESISTIDETWAVIDSPASNFEMINITFNDINLENKCNIISTSSNFKMTNVEFNNCHISNSENNLICTGDNSKIQNLTFNNLTVEKSASFIKILGSDCIMSDVKFNNLQITNPKSSFIYSQGSNTFMNNLEFNNISLVNSDYELLHSNGNNLTMANFKFKNLTSLDSNNWKFLQDPLTIH